jgi:hypothetical protein
VAVEQWWHADAVAAEVKLTVRLPVALHSQLTEPASLDQRSLNGEVIYLLRESVDQRHIAASEGPPPAGRDIRHARR